MATKFTSAKNKGLLWELMSNESPEFKRDVVHNFNDARERFEKCIEATASATGHGNGIMEMNKAFITRARGEFVGMRQPHQTKSVDVGRPVLAKDIQTARTEKMSSAFDAKKREMDSLLNTAAPAQIDFSITSDAPMLDVDDVLNKKLAERNYDTVNVVKENGLSADAAKEWIGLNGSPPPTQLADSDGIATGKEENEVVSVPGVHQVDPLAPIGTGPIGNQPEFFSRLKSMPPPAFMTDQSDDANPQTDTHHLLTMILANQKKIMVQLKIE
jgi:hypothetical protein